MRDLVVVQVESGTKREGREGSRCYGDDSVVGEVDVPRSVGYVRRGFGYLRVGFVVSVTPFDVSVFAISEQNEWRQYNCNVTQRRARSRISWSKESLGSGG